VVPASDADGVRTVLEELRITGLGVIESATLELGPGLTVITGETGAGKTMVVTALGLLLGERADSGIIRSGSDQAVIEGRWQIDAGGAVADRVRDAGGELDGSELILGRSVSSEGRSRATVGGRGAPVSVLGELSPYLVVLHGQSDQVRLRSATAQREALDRFAGHEFAALLAEYQAVFRGWQEHQGDLDVLVAEQDRRVHEAEELGAAIAEIEAIEPQRNEDAELTARADRLTNLEALRSAASEAHEALSSESPDEARDVSSLLALARRQLERVTEYDGSLGPIAEGIATASITIAELSGQLSSYLAGLDADGGRELETVQERRAQLSGLVRRFGPTLDDAIDYLDSGSARLLELENDSTRIESLRTEVDRDRERVVELAARLSDIRTANARRLGQRVTRELGALAMPNATVSVLVEDRSDYSPTGKDTVSFLLQPHVGAEPRALGKGASGGELSRVMLAIEVVIAGGDSVPTFVFDEIDAGVGGASAIEIGRRLARLSRTAQVIVVTHLAQVAAFATNHLRVVKDSAGNVTASSVEKLDGEDRIAEMARLLSGLPDSESGLAHARELIETARGLDN
jgi:DNA repair protein RecN (Recombination protein N)